jgi:hypothetical protein
MSDDLFPNLDELDVLMENVPANASLIGDGAKATSGPALALIDIKLAALAEVGGRQPPTRRWLED